MNARYLLDVVERLLTAPRTELYPLFTAELATLVPHRASVVHTGDCARTPLATAGDPAITEAVTTAEVLRLRTAGPSPALVDGVLGGAVRRLVLLSAGASLLVVVPERAEPPAEALDVAARLWRVLSVDQHRRATEQAPGMLAGSLAAAAARSQAIADLGQTFETTLTSLLTVLRSGRLPDAVARRTAIDVAAEALLDLRAVAGRDREVSSAPVSAAFAVLEEQLAHLVRHTEVEISLAGPGAEDPVPQDLAHAARAVTRGLVLAAIARPGTTRVRASWRIDGPALRITVRDDDPHAGGADGPAAEVARRLAALGGGWEADAVPGWGTTVIATLPRTAVAPADPGPLGRLHPRELEVLDGIARGLRNRAIADELRLSEHTVKFHVRNVLEKLGVRSRGEAAALAHVNQG
ncbi:LuxR C-terminal-related transcriptional regulator [Catenuloplanes atrovinosus]|uniref:DNA-binding CsgD family transcriptional regulator/signal transduction histidine kinase n=1 Tax=Catenuloplanes atrovinosus TaxID=137266 RepID=A0AAE3YIL2_9ACTN|nr:LuxR C-terminal-related transcriptional regulator [Catenuloplanes atrovinosus]MDR7274399.1 DNA-binding CsgD family transcriptional regulator/signal transduction histidine kinase [Catenuloplanes atrovinosus]